LGLVIAGVLFLVAWIIVVTLAGMFILGMSAMTAASPSADREQGSDFLLGLLVGVGLVGIAGVPGGLAFFCGRIRGILIGIAAAFVIAGVVVFLSAAGLLFS
jgi:hypothetical protein